MFSEYPPLPPQVVEQLHQRPSAFHPPQIPPGFIVRDYVYDDAPPD